jgi:hypothetical protein
LDDEVFGLKGQKLYDLKGSNIYKLNGSRHGDVVDGNAEEIRMVADKGGVAAADLISHAFVRHALRTEENRSPFEDLSVALPKLGSGVDSAACQDCSLKSQWTTGPERRIPRWEHEHLLEAVQQRLDANPHPRVRGARLDGSNIYKLNGSRHSTLTECPLPIMYWRTTKLYSGL